MSSFFVIEPVSRTNSHKNLEKRYSHFASADINWALFQKPIWQYVPKIIKIIILFGSVIFLHWNTIPRKKYQTTHAHTHKNAHTENLHYLYVNC